MARVATHYYPRRSNGWGIAGFILSLVSIVTCGLLSPLALLVSLIGMVRQPRGMATAGVIIGGLQTLAIAGVVASAVRVDQLRQTQFDANVTHRTLLQARDTIEEHRAVPDEKVPAGKVPAGIEGNKLVLHLEDAWGHSVRYDRETDTSYVVRSSGPDATFNTEDDLTVKSTPPKSTTSATSHTDSSAAEQPAREVVEPEGIPLDD